MKRMFGRSTVLIIFGAFAAMEASDLMFLLKALGSTGDYAASLGITPQQATVRLAVLVLLAAGITLAAGATMLGQFKRAPWVERAGQVTGAFFILYGLFQVGSAALVLTRDQTTHSLSGAVFILIGVALFPLGRRS